MTKNNIQNTENLPNLITLEQQSLANEQINMFYIHINSLNDAFRTIVLKKFNTNEITKQEMDVYVRLINKIIYLINQVTPEIEICDVLKDQNIISIKDSSDTICDNDSLIKKLNKKNDDK